LYIRRVPSAAKTVGQPLRGELLDFPRQALHAASLGFAHPRTRMMLSFQTAIPDDMAALINHIDRDLTAC
jgi:23S rRNA pseudouridine1911/1915/1917 synthase